MGNPKNEKKSKKKAKKNPKLTSRPFSKGHGSVGEKPSSFPFALSWVQIQEQIQDSKIVLFWAGFCATESQMVPQKCLQGSVPIISSLRLACIEGTLFTATDGLSNLVLVGNSFGISAACHLNRCGLGGGTRTWGGIGKACRDREGLFALDEANLAWLRLFALWAQACPIRPHPKTQHLPPPCVSKVWLRAKFQNGKMIQTCLLAQVSYFMTAEPRWTNNIVPNIWHQGNNA